MGCRLVRSVRETFGEARHIPKRVVAQRKRCSRVCVKGKYEAVGSGPGSSRHAHMCKALSGPSSFGMSWKFEDGVDLLLNHPDVAWHDAWAESGARPDPFADEPTRFSPKSVEESPTCAQKTRLASPRICRTRLDRQCCHSS